MASGDTLMVFSAAAGQPGVTSPATFDEVNSQLVFDFDATTNETAIFKAVMPQQYSGSGVDVICHLTMSSATSGDVDIDIDWDNQDGQVVTGASFATAQSTDNTSVPGVAATHFTVTVSFTDGAQMDSVGVGDMFRITVTRDAANDTATGDMELHAVELREA